MANAKARTVTKTRTITEAYVENDGVILELNKKETVFLAALLGWKVVGDGEMSAQSMGIFTQLRSLGYSSYSDDPYLSRDVSLAADLLTGQVFINKAE